jgi:tripartite-type tricarboxylate transporter receptor subunit TctC
MRLTLFALLSLLFAATTANGASDYPAKPIRMVIAMPVGSGPEILARQIGMKLNEAWGQPVVIDPRVGASGIIGAEIVANSAADGYTLWMATLTQLISTTMFQRFMMADRFAPVGMVASTAYVIAVNASLPVNSITELIAYSKTRPGQLLYGSSGQGTTTHLCMEMFSRMAGIDLVHVPYKGIPATLTDVMGGHIQLACASAPSVPPFVKSGRVRILGVTTRGRTMLAPDLAPITESVPGFELVGWYGLFAPLGTPKSIVSRINSAVVQALKTPEAQERLVVLGAEATPSSPAEFGAFLKKETIKWEKVLREANIRSSE